MGITKTRERMSAWVASADMYDIVVDAEGTVWRRDKYDQRWSYLTPDGYSVWDARDDLPVEYEPYLPLDDNAAAIMAAQPDSRF